ncbi:MAG: family 43 glycosylhydrolase [Opitutales bacterium]|nr:family 43 glycosylhydrolase [Opitutales bacterium]
MKTSPLCNSLAFLLLILTAPVFAGDSQPDYPVRDADKVSRIVMPGNYPDPTILKHGDKFYLTHNSDDNVPGLPIWESTDLVNWKRITNVLQKHIGAAWAPEIIHHNDEFFIYFTVMSPERVLENYVVKSKDIMGPWSEPLFMDVAGIDPGHIVDQEGNRYIYMSKGWIYDLSPDGLHIMSEGRKVYEGWEIPEYWLIECFCGESPKLIYKDGYYHLLTAQGGTAGPATSHMVVAARSKNVDGPWENSPHNPIIKTWNKSERLWSKGHGTIFDAGDDEWYMIYHGYEKNFLTLGRQVAIAPMIWDDEGWFHVADEMELEDAVAVDWRDEFDGPELLPNLAFLSRADVESGYELKKGQLILEGVGEKISDESVLLSNAEHRSYQVETKLQVDAGVTAGLVVYYDGVANGGMAVKKDTVSQIVKTNDSRSPQKIKEGSEVWLRIQNLEQDIAMFYSLDGESWEKFDFGMEVSGWHHNSFGRFRSLRIGLFAYGEGHAVFDYLDYRSL